MITTSVIGATGYAGQELVRLLHKHPETEIVGLTSVNQTGVSLADVYGAYRDQLNMILEPQDIPAMAERSDVVFLALPHGVASGLVTEDILAKTKVVDLGADFRLHDAASYQQWYGTEHQNPELLSESVYGLCELHGERIAQARLVANPGCYTTCSILALAPLMRHPQLQLQSIVVDAKSGLTGAGRGLSLGTHFAEMNESVKAYKVAAHRHTPEMEEQLSAQAGQPIRLLFTPHLVPMNRGILAACYGKYAGSLTAQSIVDMYREFYAAHPFVRILDLGVVPDTAWVKGTNFCDLGIAVDERTQTLIVIGAIDNLMKGAAGQAVQNMNLLCGLPETTGLTDIAAFPI